MKKFSRIYIEITNVCNLSCSFCVGNQREPRFLTTTEFHHILEEVHHFTDHIYLHVLGEPLLHPMLGEILEIAAIFHLQVNLTTNGTLLSEQKETLLASHSLRKISISLHSMEGNSTHFGTDYLQQVAAFVKAAREKNILCELRIWNLGHGESSNYEMFRFLCEELALGEEQQMDILADIDQKGNGTLLPGVFLGKAERFDWPGLEGDFSNQEVFCHGLRSQVGILCDGTVVPCCLDSRGDIALGNVFESAFGEILFSERARSLYDGFSKRQAREPLCKCCSYARRF